MMMQSRAYIYYLCMRQSTSEKQMDEFNILISVP